MTFIETLMLLLAAALGQPNLPVGPPPASSQHAPPPDTKPGDEPEAKPEHGEPANDVSARLRREMAKKISNGF